MRTSSFDQEKYPNTFKVAQALDMTPSEIPQFDPESEGDTTPIGFLYGVGDAGDPSVGINPCQATPELGSWEELEEFCTKHLSKYQAMGDAGEIPAKFFWEEN